MVSASDTNLNHSTGYPEGFTGTPLAQLLQLDTYISFSSWSLDDSSWSTCSCCWARLSSWDVLSSSLSSSWLVSFSLVFSTLVSSLPLRSCVHWCSNWGGRKENRKHYNWRRRLGFEDLEVSWAGSHFYQSQKINKIHMELFHCSLYRHNYVTHKQSHSILWLTLIQFKNTHKKGATKQISSIKLIFTTAILGLFPQRPGLHSDSEFYLTVLNC